jgi:hypothetical protein
MLSSVVEADDVFDDTERHGSIIDHTLAALADALREHILNQEDPLSEKRWRVAGYRFARALAQGRRKGYEMTSAFMDGLRIFSEQHSSIRPIVPFNTARADALEEKAMKLLALATHKRTGEHEVRAAQQGFAKLFSSGDLAIVSTERHEWQESEQKRLRDAVNFIKNHHPEAFPWKPDEQTPVDF